MSQFHAHSLYGHDQCYIDTDMDCYVPECPKSMLCFIVGGDGGKAIIYYSIIYLTCGVAVGSFFNFLRKPLLWLKDSMQCLWLNMVPKISHCILDYFQLFFLFVSHFLTQECLFSLCNLWATPRPGRRAWKCCKISNSQASKIL